MVFKTYKHLGQDMYFPDKVLINPRVDLDILGDLSSFFINMPYNKTLPGSILRQNNVTDVL